MASPVTGVGSTTATSTTSGSSAPVENPGAILDRDSFLKLLVAQLKYQDPTSPADASQIVAQSAQLTMVDRLNELSESFTSANALSRMSLASSMVGKNITFVDTDGSHVWAPVDGVTIDGTDVVLSAAGRSVPLEAVSGVLSAQDATSV